MDVGESDRLFTFEVAKTNEREEGAVSRPGFQVDLLPIVFVSISDISISKMISRLISRCVPPDGCLIDPSTFVPRLLCGETAQGFLTTTYVQRQVRCVTLSQRAFTGVYLTELL